MHLLVRSLRHRKGVCGTLRVPRGILFALRHQLLRYRAGAFSGRLEHVHVGLCHGKKMPHEAKGEAAADADGEAVAEAVGKVAGQVVGDSLG